MTLFVRKTLTGLYPSNKEPRYLLLHRTFDKISILVSLAFVNPSPSVTFLFDLTRAPILANSVSTLVFGGFSR